MFNFNNRLFIIRHALTPQNTQNLCLGWTNNLPDTRNIQNRVNQCISWLNGNKIDIIISSNLPRAQITAKSISKALVIPRIFSSINFNDLNFGYFSLKSPKLISQIQPEIFDNKGQFKYNIALKDGESLQDLENRVKLGLKEIQTKTVKFNVLLVTHGSVVVMIHKIITNQNYYIYYPRIEEESKNKLYQF